MAGGLFVSGLISGIDTDVLIAQLMALERTPINRTRDRIGLLEDQQDAVRDIRTDLLTLFNRAQDFTLNNVFEGISGTSSDETVLTAEISSTVASRGSYAVQVTQLASATVAVSSSYLGTPVDPDATLEDAGFGLTPTSGTFTINGTQITVDATTDSLNDIIQDITNNTDVTASYSAVTNKITLTNTDGGSSDIINLGADDDTSNFLEAGRLEGAFQSGTPTTMESTVDISVVDPNATLDDVFGIGTVSAGTFQVNGVTLNITDPSTETLNDILNDINSSGADVTATFDSSTDTIRVVSDTLGSRTINFTDGTSGFLAATNLDTATQTTGNDAQFTVDGQGYTRNSNTITDVIGGVSFTLLSAGSSTVTVTDDVDTMVDTIESFVEAYNTAIGTIDDALAEDEALENDASIRMIMSYLRSSVFNIIDGATGEYRSLVDIGVSTGTEDAFSSDTLNALQVDATALRDALNADRESVASLFINDSEDGIANIFEEYLRDVTSTTGFLQSRAGANGTIADQIESLNDRIDQLEQRLDQKEERLRRQFTQMEVMLSSFQSTSEFLTMQLAGLQGLGV